jgi:hypothetical protein
VDCHCRATTLDYSDPFLISIIVPIEKKLVHCLIVLYEPLELLPVTIVERLQGLSIQYTHRTDPLQSFQL